MNKMKSVIMQMATVAAVAVPVVCSQASVFDDARAWYRGAVDANGDGVFADNAGCWPDVLHAADASSVTHGSTLLGSAPGTDPGLPDLLIKAMDVHCPYANETLANVPCLVLPQPVTTNGFETVDGKEYPIVSGKSNALVLPDLLAGYSGNCSKWSSVIRFRVDEPYNRRYNVVTPVAFWGLENASGGSGVMLSIQRYNGNTGGWPVLRVANQSYTHCQDDTYPDDIETTKRTTTRIEPGQWVDFAISVDNDARRIFAAYVYDVDGASKRIRTWEITGFPANVYLGIRNYWHRFRLGCENWNAGDAGTWTIGVTDSGAKTQVFRGAYHQFAFWTRTLTLDEMKEAMSNGHPSIFKIGSEAADVSKLYKKTTSEVDSRGRWEELDTELESAGQQLTIDYTYRFPGESSLAQVLRVKADGASAAGTVAVTVNDGAVSSMAVVPGGYADVFIKGKYFKDGVNKITLRRTDALGGSVKLNAFELCGSWERGTGKAENMGHEFTSTNHFDLADGNLLHYHKSLYNRSDKGAAVFNMLATNTIAFKLAPEMVGSYKATFKFTTAWKGTSAPFPIDVLLNGTSVGRVDSVASAVTYEFKLPSSLLAADNLLALSVPNDTEHLINIPKYRLEIKNESGMMLIFR